MSRDSFIFYRSFFEALQPLTVEDKALLMDAICLYALDGGEMELTPIAKAMFGLIRPQLDANHKKYLNGKQGGRPRETKPEPNHNLDVTKPEANGNGNENANENGKKVSQETAKPKPKGKYECATGVELTEILENGFLPRGWIQVAKIASRLNEAQLSAIEQRFVRHYTTGEGKDAKRDGVGGWNECFMSGWVKKEKVLP